MKCPKCNAECIRDEVDVGVGVMFGPWGCMCGWSEDSRYDSSEGESTAQKEYPEHIVDSRGGIIPRATIYERLEHFGIDSEGMEL